MRVSFYHIEVHVPVLQAFVSRVERMIYRDRQDFIKDFSQQKRLMFHAKGKRT